MYKVTHARRYADILKHKHNVHVSKNTQMIVVSRGFSGKCVFQLTSDFYLTMLLFRLGILIIYNVVVFPLMILQYCYYYCLLSKCTLHFPYSRTTVIAAVKNILLNTAKTGM